ncbi:hypothetical protein LCGC14_2741070, partial [marine sediment metagenome]
MSPGPSVGVVDDELVKLLRDTADRLEAEDHGGLRGVVVVFPETGDGRANPGQTEGPLQALDALAAGHLAQPGLAGRQND